GVTSRGAFATRSSEPAVADVPLVEAVGLSKRYELHGHVLGRVRREEREAVRAVDDVSLRIMRGDTVGLVGESGCGKSTFGRLLLQLEPPTAGEVRYEGAVVDKDGVAALRRKAQIIFQDPFSSLNPRKTVRRAIEEVLAVHRICPREGRKARVEELLERVGLSPDMASRRPRQFSGGQRHRARIAPPPARDPELLA